MLEVIYLSFVVACISFTMADSKLFSTPRNWVHHKGTFLKNLTSCGYCTGHWVAFILEAIYRPRILESFWLLDYFLTAIIMAWLGGLQWSIFCLILSKTDK